MGFNQEKITISDVAEALGISKTTVSRAISGKGRIGEETRQKVIDYIREHDYVPSPIAKGLANSRNYNIGWVMPGDSTVTDLPFFQRCMIGISEIANKRDYDMILTLVYDGDITALERIVKNHKIDGIILGRTLIEDERVEFLKASNVPFVAIGSSEYREVIQIDNDHISACKELTSVLISKGIKKIALIGGKSNHVVNRTRLEGFKKGVKESGLTVDEAHIFMDADDPVSVSQAVETALQDKMDCIVCMDDRICLSALDCLKKDGVSIPKDIKIASFYNSSLLENYVPSITALQYDPKVLGMEACNSLLDMIDGIDVPNRKLLGYEVVLKDSTKE